MDTELGVYLAKRVNSFHSQGIYNLGITSYSPQIASLTSLLWRWENTAKAPDYSSGKLNLVCASSITEMWN